MEALVDAPITATGEADTDTLEEKIDAGFGEMRRALKGTERELRAEIKGSERELRAEIIAARTDARSDFRTLVALVVSLWAATVLTVLAAHL
jgi:hypothetical protein